LSRIIKTESAGKDRGRRSKEIVLAIRELMKQTNPDNTTRDLAAFITLALEEIAQTIDLSVAAWEKRDYWVKADRFRMEWSWVVPQGSAMRHALETDNWAKVALTSITVAQKFNTIKIATHHRLGTPWVGAWEKFVSSK
jgi:hypothetical protein